MNVLRGPALLLNGLVLGAFAVAVEHYWGWGRLLTPWRQIQAGTLLLAVLGMLLSYLLRALRIYVAEQAIPRGAYGSCLRLILINNALNWIVPARAGEASFPLLMKRWFGVDPARATGTLLWLRLLDLHVLGSVAAACVAAGWLGNTATTLARIGWLLTALAPLLLFVLRTPLAVFFSRREGRLAALAVRVAGGLPGRVSGLFLDLLLTWAGWMVKLIALGVVLATLANLAPTLGLLGAIGGDLSTVLPVHAPGGFGTYEAGVLALLSPIETPSGALLAAAVNLHLLVLTTALLAGAAAWMWGGYTRREVTPPDAKL